MKPMLVALGFLIAGIAIIKFFERTEKRKNKVVQIDLDEHERMISQN